MSIFSKFKKERKPSRKKLMNEVIIQMLEKSQNCETCEMAGNYLDLAKDLIELQQQDERNLIDKVQNVTKAAEIMAFCGAEVGKLKTINRSIDQAAKDSREGIIDTTTYGKPIKQNLFKELTMK